MNYLLFALKIIKLLLSVLWILLKEDKSTTIPNFKGYRILSGETDISIDI